MKYARLGDTGLIVSKLAFGAMTFGEIDPNAVGGRAAGFAKSVYKVDQTLAGKLVAQAIEGGVNHFNTADVYAGGQSETMLGKALGAKRRDVVISTKVGNRVGGAVTASGLSRGHVLRAAEDSLRRLGTDYIDVYLAHRPDPWTPLEETLDAFDLLVKQGKVRYVGFSNWQAWAAAKAIGYQKARGYEPMRAGEMYYSLVGRDLEAEIVPFAVDSGVGIFVWSPLAGGFLSGKYTREDPSGGGGRLDGFDFMPIDKDKGYAVVDVLKRVAAAHDATPAAVALAWLVAKPTVASVLTGASTEAQLSANLAAGSLVLSPDEIGDLDRSSAPAPVYPGSFGIALRDQATAKALGEA